MVRQCIDAPELNVILSDLFLYTTIVGTGGRRVERP
jgi:hypothetical protein